MEVGERKVADPGRHVMFWHFWLLAIHGRRHVTDPRKGSQTILELVFAKMGIFQAEAWMREEEEASM